MVQYYPAFQGLNIQSWHACETSDPILSNKDSGGTAVPERTSETQIRQGGFVLDGTG